MEASVIIIKCPQHKRAFGARVQRMNDGDWWRTWAFPIDLKLATGEGYTNNMVRGSLCTTSEYPGCPHCKTHGFVQCGSCQKLSCYNGESALQCQWCGILMNNIVAGDSFDVSGDAF